MLVLTRKYGEEIVIKTKDEEIRVMVVQIKGKQTRIGIEASEDVTIYRAEIENKEPNKVIKLH